AKEMSFSGPFIAANISSMISAARIVDTRYNLKLEDKYMLSQAPITEKSMIIKQAFEVYINAVLKNRIIRYRPSITIPKKAVTQKDLLQVEDEVKKISLYLWISYKMPDLFPDNAKARMTRESLNKFIEKSLKKGLLSSSNDRNKYEQKSNNYKRTPRRNSKRDSKINY
ncbi:MAG: RNA helicase, partial [Campylobacteraceae bacterium]|nr:RNA helicase [Campylobacteraceae bacterium]